MNELTHLVRVDKNFAFNIQAFRQYEDDAKILKALMIYMAYDSQKDLFGFYKIEPEEFAKVMFFNKDNLFRKHPEPKQLQKNRGNKLLELEQKHGRMSEYRTWSNCLENALYLLNTETIIKDYRHKTEQKAITSVQSFTFLEEIRYELIKTGKTKKIIYKYRPNQKFEENLRHYFLNTRIKKFNLLKKPKLDDAYLDLLNRINNCNYKHLNSITFKLDDFAAILGISPYKRFSSYKSKINEKFEILKETIGEDVKGLKLTWGKSSDHIQSLENALTVNKKNIKVKYDNVPILTWDRPDKEVQNQEDALVYKNIFDTQLIKSLSKACFNTYEEKITNMSEEDKISFFYRWFFSEKDMDVKTIVYKESYLSVYKNTKGLPTHAQVFQKLIKKISGIQKKYKVIAYKEELLYLYEKNQTKTFEHLYQLLNYFKEKHL